MLARSLPLARIMSTRTSVFRVQGWWLVLSLAACTNGLTDDNDLGSGGGPDLAVDPSDMSVGCGLNTCQSMGVSCGPIGDGCGGTLYCGGCPGSQTCGGGGVHFQCGGENKCVPRTCADVGADCGPIGDGCGGIVQCGGACPAGQFCGGGGPSACGAFGTD